MLFGNFSNFKPYHLNNLIRNFSTSWRNASSYPGNKIEVKGHQLHYEQVGNGKHKLLLLPGAVGTTRSDFAPQLENLNHDKFTLVAVDPLGYGFSRPPDRSYPRDMYYKDAEMAALLMKVLNHEAYSVVGWSDGGITGLIMAATNPNAVRKLIVFGANAYVTENDAKLMEDIRDLNKWSDKMKAPLIALYGQKYFEQLWDGYVNFYTQIYSGGGGDICKQELEKIVCPTLIVHGDQDPIVDSQHPLYLLEHIKNAKLHRMPEGKHNLHLRYAAEFNKLVEEFLDQ